MKRKDTEISSWSEIFHNKKYTKLSSLKGILTENEEAVKKILSLRIPIYENRLPEAWIEQYNIETQKYITNITSHNGLDLHLQQHNKSTWETQMYSPYSSPWYNVYANLLCAYYELFKKKPILNFPNTDSVWRNKQIESHDIPLMNDMLSSYRDVFPYIHYHEFFQKDTKWIHRIIPKWEKGNEREEAWFGIQWEEAIFQFIDYFYQRGTRHKFFIEKELINVFLQMLIDVNRKTSWSVGNLNLKKIADVLYKALEEPEIRKNSEKLSIRSRYEKFEEK